MTRVYVIATPDGPRTLVARRAVVESGGVLALYAVLGEREALVAAFGPAGWLRFEIASDASQ